MTRSTRQKYRKDLEDFSTGGKTFTRRALGKLALGGATAAAVLGNVRALNAAANDDPGGWQRRSS